jgi:putative membrane protein
MFTPPVAFDANTLHLGEFLPPLLAGGIYVPVYFKRAWTLKHQGRPVPGWRVVSFVAAVVTVVAIQLPPFDTIADEVLLAHMAQHIIIGEICSLFIVLGLTGAMLQPLLYMRFTRPFRVLTNPLVALALWAVDLYTWHLPLFYQLAIRHDLVHAIEHACLLWFGMLLWLALLGPLPKPAWYESWGGIGYIFGVRCVGAVLGNFLLWTQTVIYPVYRASDARRGLNPVSDQNLAGGLMDTVQIVLTTLLMCWLFMRWARRDEDRQALLDLAADHRIELSDERASRAAIAGTTGRLRERVLNEGSARAEQEKQPVP